MSERARQVVDDVLEPMRSAADAAKRGNRLITALLAMLLIDIVTRLGTGALRLIDLVRDCGL